MFIDGVVMCELLLVDNIFRLDFQGGVDVVGGRIELQQ